MKRLILALLAVTSFAVAQAPANDTCAGAIPLVVATPAAGTTVGATAEGPACGTGFLAASVDVFYSYTPAVNEACTLLRPTGTGIDKAAVFAGGCGTLTPVSCTVTAAISATTPCTWFAQAGVTYIIRVGKAASPFSAFTVNLTTAVPLANDDCSTPITLADGVNPNAPAGTSGTTFTSVGATTSVNPGALCLAGGSFGAGSYDTWFSYTAALTAPTIVQTCTPAGFTAGTFTDSNLQVFTGSCGALTEVICDTDSCVSPNFNSLLVLNAVASTTYLIRVSGFSTSPTSTSGTGTFYVSVTPPPPPPSNDECAAAAVAILGANAGSTASSSTSTDPVGACSGFTATTLDTWHVFTAPFPATFAFGLSGTGANQIGLYDNVCGSGVSLACGTTSASLALNLGDTVRVRVGQSTVANQGSYSLNITASIAVTNDECSGAIQLFDGVNPAAPNGVSGFVYTSVGATASAGYSTPIITWPGTGANISALHCPFSTSIGPDVWFSYTATCTAVTISHCTPPGFATASLGDSTIEVYSDCSTTTPIACNDDTNSNGCTTQASVQVATVPGTTYLIRAKQFGTGTGTFYMTVRKAGSVEDLVKVGCGATPAPRLMGTPPIAGGTGIIFGAQFDANSPGTLYYSYCGAAPTDLTSISAGCFGYLDEGTLIAIISFTTDSTGRIAISGPLPNDAFFNVGCVPACFQMAVAPTDGVPSLQLSNLLTLYIGK